MKCPQRQFRQQILDSLFGLDYCKVKLMQIEPSAATETLREALIFNSKPTVQRRFSWGPALLDPFRFLRQGIEKLSISYISQEYVTYL